MNLSCGKCKAIRSFSGTPPTCEVCGWVCSTTNMRAMAGSKRTDNSNYKPRNTGSGGGLFILLLILGVLVFVWSRLSSESSDNNKVAGPEPEPSSEASIRECVEPENPYSEGTGHYAGYEWAERNGSSCSTSSQSFNEGCEEYETQESEYEECEAENKK